MKKIFLFFILFFTSFLTSFSFDLKSIQPTSSYVVDKVWVLNQEEKNLLENKIKEIQTKYTSEILLLIISTTDWQDISQLWTEIWQEVWVWKSDKDNWIVILTAIDDRAWNISTWYWVEWVLPDLLVNRIWEKNFSLFKEQKYFEWFSGAINDIDLVLSWDESIISSLKSNNQEEIPTTLIFLFVWIVIFSKILFLPLIKAKKFNKFFISILIWYLITLPIVIFVIWLSWILINIFLWIFWSIFWIFWKFNGSWRSWSSKWWWFGWFWWWSFGWWWSSWKW